MTSSEPSSDRLPRWFGRYLLFDQIGEGGMARIFLARSRTDLGAERLVVVKRILPILARSPEFSQLLVDEAKLAARLAHGSIVQVYDLGREEDTLYIAMEYVEGFDLRQLLIYCSKSRIPLPIEFGLLAVMETLRGLDYAHRKKDEDGHPLGIVHRDVSPSNVLLSFDGEVKLCDFGIARAIGASLELPAEAIQGKAGYMSPETARGEAIDARSDLFSVGVMLWELISGRRMYGKSATLEQAREAKIGPLPQRGYPEEAELHRIVFTALARDPASRHAAARDMLRALDDYVRRAGLVASPLRFGEWLLDRFGAEILEWRKTRELAAKALELAPPYEGSPASSPLASAPFHSHPFHAPPSAPLHAPPSSPFHPPPSSAVHAPPSSPFHAQPSSALHAEPAQSSTEAPSSLEAPASNRAQEPASGRRDTLPEAEPSHAPPARGEVPELSPVASPVGAPGAAGAPGGTIWVVVATLLLVAAIVAFMFR